MESMRELFVEMLNDVYSAENQLVEALPKMAKQASSDELRHAIQTHLSETENQVQRLDRIFADIKEEPGDEECEAMAGLIEEAEAMMEDAESDQIRDAGMIASAQAVEHYEIARYGTLRTWAQQLGLDSAKDLLQATLEEEKHADETLNKIAMNDVNRVAAS